MRIKEKIDFSDPSEERPYPIGNGRQLIWKFKNGFGASVVQFKIPITNSFGSYTNNDNEWELAVIKFKEDNFSLTYETEITNDVIGYLTKEKVEKLLMKIKSLK